MRSVRRDDASLPGSNSRDDLPRRRVDHGLGADHDGGDGLVATGDGAHPRHAQRRARAAAIRKILGSKEALLATLTARQQAAVAAAAQAGGGGTATAVYTGPTSTGAGRAIAFAYAQLGKPYVWGATGPGAYDCSGLVKAAWAAAGVSIPRTTYEQWAALRHIPMSAIQPGDLIFFNSQGHVAVYVGNNQIIDALQPGGSV